jgi:hypothetical protein
MLKSLLSAANDILTLPVILLVDWSLVLEKGLKL